VSAGEPPGPDPVRLLYRHVLEERARRLFPAGSRVLRLPRTSDDDGPFDGAYAGPGALDGADLESVGRSLAAALRPGAPVLICIARRRPGMVAVGIREAQSRLGPGFSWSAGFGLGVLLPGEAREAWARGHPQAFGVLAALESIVRGWPIFRGLGECTALLGSRRSDRTPDTL
jgi:hypothetical protein